jgi:hypothetical protein
LAFKGTCCARGWPAFFRCTGSRFCHSILLDADVVLIMICSWSLWLLYSQHAYIESFDKFDAQLCLSVQLKKYV